VTDKPIIFSTSMAQALWDGRKTQTRRVTSLKGLRWTKGDRLYVRETFCHFPDSCPDGMGELTYYAANQRADQVEEENRIMKRNGVKWRPSIHMPRLFSRMTLNVTDVRVERLNDISERDAVAEGLINKGDHTWPVWSAGEGFKDHLEFPIGAFRELWESINGAGSWGANPWVAVITFDVVKANIDQIGPVS
jgi:hypothetical protein